MFMVLENEEKIVEDNKEKEEDCCKECKCCHEEECVEKQEEIKEVVDKKTKKKIDELNDKIAFLEKTIDNLKREENKKIIDFVEKKSKEASEIIQRKETELTEKYKSEYESKLKYYYSSQLSELVEIVSQFELVINGTTNPEVANYLVGFKMFLSQFESLLKSLSITDISPNVGDEFNSDTMEATSTKKVDDEKMDNKITSVFKKGYSLHERVIKLASVEVGKLSS